MRPLAFTTAVAAVLFLSAQAATAEPASGSGPRGPSGGVESAPVDRLGPTLPPDPMLQPDSGWNQRSTGGANGPNYTMTQPLFGPPLPTLPRHKPRIILGQ